MISEDQQPVRGLVGLEKSWLVAHRTRVWAAGVTVFAVVAWLVFVRPVTPLDLDIFITAGRAVVHGHDPFPALGTAQVWSGSGFVYPWLTAWLFAPTAALSLPSAVLLMAGLSMLAIAVGVRCVLGPRLVPFACVLFASPTLDGLQMGTLNAVLFLGLCLAWRWRDRPAPVGMTIGILVTLKILCWPLVVWLILTRRRAGAAWAIGASAVLLGVGWVLGPLGPVRYADLLRQLGSHEMYTTAGLQGVLVRWSLPVTAAELIGLGCAAALVTMTAKSDDPTIYAATVVAALLASPVVWHHYYLLAAAPLLLVRNGPWWYLVVGWASTAARPTGDLSWVLVSVAAGATVAVVTIVGAWRVRHVLRESVRRCHRSWVAGFAGAAVLVATLSAVIGVDAFTRALAPSLVPVAASCGLLVAGCRRTPQTRQAPDSGVPASSR